MTKVTYKRVYLGGFGEVESVTVMTGNVVSTVLAGAVTEGAHGSIVGSRESKALTQ
jgi:hypothetical protein